MALFGGSKSSSTTKIDETNTNSVDNRVGGEGSFFGGNNSVVGSQGDVNISTTDFGAIDAAIKANIDVSNNAFNFASDSNKRALSFAGDALDSAFNSADEFAGQAFDLTGDVIDANNKQFKFVAEQTAQQFDRSLAFAENANKSENQQFLESGLSALKMGGVLLFGGIAAFYFLKKG